MFDRIRSGAAAVMRAAHRVRIDESALDALAARLASDPMPGPVWDPALCHAGDAAGRLAFAVTWNCINFGSGWFPKLRKREGCSGAITVMTGLKERFDREGPFFADELEAIEAATLAPVIGQDLADPECAELIDLYARALRTLGQLLNQRFGGSFDALVAAAEGSAARLVEILAEMPFYRDEAAYPGIGRVSFYKRAQLTAADLALALDGRGRGAFDDLDRLTIFADNLVPHVFRHFGVLVFDRALAETIEREELIAAGSPEEIEIRAGGVHAAEGLVARLAALGRPLPAHTLDVMLWTWGQRPEVKARPRHRARGVWY